MSAIVSAIVPVYNMEAYLMQCLDSILNQTFREIELILIDDGSTDASSAICDRYAENDSRVKVFHKTNDGPASAKNFGMEKASGKYLIFISADDFWTDRDCLAKLVQLAEKTGADIVKGEYRIIDQDGRELRRELHRKWMDGKETSAVTMFSRGFDGEFSCSLTLIRKKALSSLTFDESYSFEEDAELLARLFMRPLKCAYSATCFYTFRVHCRTISSSRKTGNVSCSFSLPAHFARCAKSVSGRLRREYLRYSMRLYHRALEMISEKRYWDSRESLIKALDIDAIHRKVCGLMFRHMLFDRHFMSIIASPSAGTALIRLKGKIFRPIRHPRIGTSIAKAEYRTSTAD